MGLKPLEFSDSITDSPWFRENLKQHEYALDDAYKNIKNIETQCRELINCTKKLSIAQKAFAKSLSDFKIESVGTNQTDDERVISSCLREFGTLICRVEEERSKIINEADQVYLEPLRRFRTEVIGRILSEEKKKYKEAASKFHSNLEKHLHLSTVRKNDFKEADAQLDIQQRDFFRASLQYVAEIQSVQEKMKFEFVEVISSFIYSWLTFYKVGAVIHEDFQPFLDSIQVKVQKTKENFKCTQDEAQALKDKILQTHTKAGSACAGEWLRQGTSNIRQGYLYVQEKSKLPKKIGRDVLLSSWTKYYSVYTKETRIFTLLPTKSDMKDALMQATNFKLKDCIRRSSDSIDKRFCFDVVGEIVNPANANQEVVYTLQALSEEDRRQWLDALDGKQPIYSPGTGPSCSSLATQLDKRGFDFVDRCIATIERKGITEQGIYRNCGVTSKVQKLMQLGLEQAKGNTETVNWDDSEWEMKTLSSALKTFLRNLPEPLMTFDLHSLFINAAKMDDQALRINHIHYYVHQLPPDHLRMLEIVIRHLKRVSDSSSINLMTVGNLGVCFGPTLLRPKEETMAAIMDIKFFNVVVEVLIANCNQIFDTQPPQNVGQPAKPDHSSGGNGQAATTPSGYHHDRTFNNGAFAERSYMESSRQANPIYDVPANDNLPRYQASSATTSSHPHAHHHPQPHPHPHNQHQQTSFAGSAPSSSPNRFHASKESGTHTGDSSDSLNSLQSAGSESPREGGPRRTKLSTSYAPAYNPEPRRVRTLYPCTPDHDSELSFQAGQIITNVYESKEDGWLVGTLNGKTGLIPANYVEPLP